MLDVPSWVLLHRGVQLDTMPCWQLFQFGQLVQYLLPRLLSRSVIRRPNLLGVHRMGDIYTLFIGCHVNIFAMIRRWILGCVFLWLVEQASGDMCLDYCGKTCCSLDRKCGSGYYCYPFFSCVYGYLCYPCKLGFYCPAEMGMLACPDGQTTLSGGQSSCVSCPAGYDCVSGFAATCKAGYYCTWEYISGLCSAGYFSNAGASSCSSCPAGVDTLSPNNLGYCLFIDPFFQSQESMAPFQGLAPVQAVQQVHTLPQQERHPARAARRVDTRGQQDQDLPASKRRAQPALLASTKAPTTAQAAPGGTTRMPPPRHPARTAVSG